MKKQQVLIQLLGLFYAVFIFCAIFLQVLDGELSPNTPSVIDLFCGALLWISSFVALLIAADRVTSATRLLMWLAISAVTGALAIDEVFEFHERSSAIIGDDDYIKIIMWFAAGIGLFIVHRLEKTYRSVTSLFVAGYICHTLYLLIDIGDGDFYTLPLKSTVSIWAEEILELLFVQLYLAGLTLIHALTPRSTRRVA